MLLQLDVSRVAGLTPEEQATLDKLVAVYRDHEGKNETKNRYYEGRVTLGEVNLGLALPDGMTRLEIGCAWGAKCVDVLAARSMFDGFVGENGNPAPTLAGIVSANNLIAEYGKATRDELKLGCTFAALTKDKEIGCKIRFYSPASAAAIWDGDKGRIKAGLAIVATVEDDLHRVVASTLYFHTDAAVIVLQRQDEHTWVTTRFPHKMGRPLMEPLIWNATSGKPFGRSRIKEPVRRLIQGYVRTMANATIGLEFATAPQKYLLGLTDDQYDAVINQKFRQYVGNMLASTTNPETGEKPTFGQLPQGTIQPHVDMLRALATQFSAATGLSVTDTGVINDANPTSSDAIQAQTQTLIAMAQELNTGNGNSLRIIALMAQAVARDVGLDELTDEERDVIAHFKNPAMPSIAATADAATKIAASRQGFADTDVYLEMVGFDQADIRRIRAQEAKARGLAVAAEIEAGL